MASGQGHGNMSLSMKLIRLIIVLFNVAFITVGIALVVIGIVMIKDSRVQQLRPLLNTDIAKNSQNMSTIEVIAYALIAIGGFLIITGFFGCCGAIKGFRFLHVLYAIIIGGIILVEVGIIIMFLIYQNRFKSDLLAQLQASIINNYVGPPINNSTSTNPVSLSWDYLQFNLQCCGAANGSDFINATKWNRTNPYNPSVNLVFPFTCCPMSSARSWTQLPTNMTEATQCATTGTNVYTSGCYDRLMDLLAAIRKYIIIGAIIVGVIEVLALVFALTLYFRKSEYNAV